MTARKPLVIVSGLQQELPAADIIAPGATLTTTQRDALVSPGTGQQIFNSTKSQPEYYDGTIWRNYAGEPSIAISQLLGSSTAANIAEVEATKALRVTMRPLEVTPTDDFVINQYSVGSDAIAQSVTTTAGTDVVFFLGAWFAAGFSIIRQIRASFWTSALSGTRNGTCVAKLWHTSSIIGTSNGNFLVPDGGASPAAGTNRLTLGLDGRQPPSQMDMVFGANIAVGTNLDVPELEPLGVVYGECKNAIGSHIKNEILFDAKKAEVPLYLLRRQGFYVTFSYPAAVTSQTVNASLNIRWDEYFPARAAQ
jgi:hypothetical protein